MRILTAITTLFCVSSIIYSAIAADTTADDEEADRLIVAMAEKSETATHAMNVAVLSMALQQQR